MAGLAGTCRQGVNMFRILIVLSRGKIEGQTLYLWWILKISARMPPPAGEVS